MMKSIRSKVALAALVTLASSVGFAQSGGEATYKAKCQGCHGAAGLAETSVGKALKVKPASFWATLSLYQRWSTPASMSLAIVPPMMVASGRTERMPSMVSLTSWS